MASMLVSSALRRAAALALAGLGLLAAPAQADAPWSLRLPKEEAVIFRGVASFDSAGSGSGAMVYPGVAGVGGFIAAVITHGLLVESAKNSQRKALQDNADQVLVPYRAVLDGIKHPELMRRAMARTASASGGKLLGASEPGGGWILESIPAYAMTQDERALVLDNSVTIHRGGEGSNNAYQAVIRVVSQPRTEEDSQAFWNRNEGVALKEEITSLLAHSLELALYDARAAEASDPAVFKTVRYREGATEKMERAQLIARRCSREVIRTLRGWLMSVPGEAAGEAAAQACQPALPGWK
jgi:hypothetical protein